MHIFMLESNSWKKLNSSQLSKSEIENILRRAGEDASQALAFNAGNVNIVFKPDLPYVREKTGVGGSAFDAEMLDMTFDPTLPYGAEKCREYLRNGVFHEINHVVHFAAQGKSDDILFWVIAEGLAVVFERTADAANHPWNKYESDKTMQAWLHELRTAEDPNDNKWYTRHPDGRENIAYKTGAWIVDQAIERSNKTIAELTRLHYTTILSLAGLNS